MQEVADRAHVSIATVSHVINKTRFVSDDVAHRVVEAMDSLGYHPNRIARSLRTRRTDTIGLVIPDAANPYFADIAAAVEHAARQIGLSTVFCNSAGSADIERHYLKVLSEHRVDGIILVGSGTGDPSPVTALNMTIPVVIVDRDEPGFTGDSIHTDNEYGGWIATRKLTELGHRSIMCFAGPDAVMPSNERVDGYRRALEVAGLSNYISIAVGEFDAPSGYRLTMQALTANEPPTAIFACNDLMAVGALSAAHELNVSVPDELSVVGFDDIDLAQFTVPPLTTVAQPRAELGAAAVNVLATRIRGEAGAVTSSVPPCRIVNRHSTAPPPIATT
ncbi:MAG: LacI family transcriptional regulator [Actinobacteria bacterium]|nr:LacI family transcriptional regulator [Actinomycetota bacterium]